MQHFLEMTVIPFRPFIARYARSCEGKFEACRSSSFPRIELIVGCCFELCVFAGDFGQYFFGAEPLLTRKTLQAEKEKINDNLACLLAKCSGLNPPAPSTRYFVLS